MLRWEAVSAKVRGEGGQGLDAAAGAAAAGGPPQPTSAALTIATPKNEVRRTMAGTLYTNVGNFSGAAVGLGRRGRGRLCELDPSPHHVYFGGGYEWAPGHGVNAVVTEQHSHALA